MAVDFAKAERIARGRGLVHLAELFQKMHRSSTSVPPPRDPSRKPRLCIVVDHKGWCGERLSLELMKYWPQYDCTIARLGDGEHLSFDYDVFMYRNITWIHSVPLPDWVYRRLVVMLESERPISRELTPLYNRALLVAPQNERIRALAEAAGVRNMVDTIGNGINCEEFYPAEDFPDEFTVGAAGNFANGWYDEWKGFSRYIVPACALAGVKLKWCGWRGVCELLPDQKGEQVPLEKMADWYRGLSCLVSMSKAEGCSGVVFEAMATGLPVISTPVGWHAEQCTDEVVWAWRPEDQTPENDRKCVEALALQIVRLKNDYKAARALGARARAFAEKWPHKRIADQWSAIIDNVLRAAEK